MSGGITWLDYSEICYGLIVTKRIDATKFSPTLFCDPYNHGFELFFKGANKTKLSAELGPALESAIQASKVITDENAVDVEWHKNLQKAARYYALGKRLEPAAKRLIRGEEIKIEDATELATSFRDLADPDTVGLVASNTIDMEGYEPTMLSGYAPIDTHLGGIPEAGNILVMGQTSVGKSLYSQQFAGHFLRQYPNKKVGIWSLEMTNKQYLSRGVNLYPLFRKAHKEGRVLVSDTTTDIYTIGIEAASAGVGMIIVDYIDYLIKGESGESKYAEIYVQMNNISRSLNIPFMMLLQPNRNSYVQGVPKMWHARYSGMAENVSAQFWTLFQPKSEDDCNGDFTFVEDSMYIVAWKQRFGWLTADKSTDGQGRKGPGAIILPVSKNVWSDVPGSWMTWGAQQQEHRVVRKRSKE